MWRCTWNTLALVSWYRRCWRSTSIVLWSPKCHCWNQGCCHSWCTHCGQLQIKKGRFAWNLSVLFFWRTWLPDSIIPKEFADGIQILPEDAVPGDSIFPYLDLDDEIIELSITPNRADALLCVVKPMKSLQSMANLFTSQKNSHRRQQASFW